MGESLKPRLKGRHPLQTTNGLSTGDGREMGSLRTSIRGVGAGGCRGALRPRSGKTIRNPPLKQGLP